MEYCIMCFIFIPVFLHLNSGFLSTFEVCFDIVLLAKSLKNIEMQEEKV